LYFRSGEDSAWGSLRRVLVEDGTTGNVGIGTTSPDKLLHVVGSANDETVALFSTAGGTSGSVQGLVHIGLTHFSSDANPSVSFTAEEIDNGDYRANLLFNTRSAESDAAPAERMRITYDGRVGINDTAPAAWLEIDADSDDGSIHGLKVRRNDSTTAAALVYIVEDSTSADSTALHVKQDATSQLAVLVEGNMCIDAYGKGADSGLFFREGNEDTSQPSITVKDFSGANPDGLAINAYDGIGFNINDVEMVVIEGDGGTSLKRAGIITLTSATNLSGVNHAGRVLNCTSAITLTLQATPAVGEQYVILNNSSGTITIDSASSTDTINGSTSAVTITTQYDALTLIALSANAWIAIG